MNSIRSILLHVDATPRCAARIALAKEIAARHDATVTALYAATASAPTLLGEGSSLLGALRDLDGERRQQARKTFDAAAGARLRWAEIDTPDAAAGFAHEALFADLLVLGQNDPAEPGAQGVPSDFAPSVIVESGRPAIVVPYAGDFARTGTQVLVAWKPTRESARALSAALPLLRNAERVHVSSWGDDPAALLPLLRSHGIEPHLHREPPAGAEIGEYVLSRAAELGADLLVMGCYGHSRMRELVLGGATRTIFDSMTLPVLMAH